MGPYWLVVAIRARARTASMTLTDIAFPICSPISFFPTTVFILSGLKPCSLSISSVVIRRFLLVIQWPCHLLAVMHGDKLSMCFVLLRDASQSTIQCSVSGLPPFAKISFLAFAMLRACVLLCVSSISAAGPSIESMLWRSRGRGHWNGFTPSGSFPSLSIPTQYHLARC